MLKNKPLKIIIIDYANKAKHKELKYSDIDSMLHIVDKLRSQNDKISLLKFCERYARRGGLSSSKIKKILASYYAECMSREQDPKKKLLFSSWAKRYDDQRDHDLRIIKDILIALQNTTAIYSQFDFLQYLDGFYSIDFNNNSIFINLLNCSITWEMDKLIDSSILHKSPINSKRFEFSFQDNSESSIYGFTHNGNKLYNDDNILAALLSNNQIIVGLADGSGNSSNANIVSYLALSSFLFAYINTMDITTAMDFSSSAVRNFNCQTNKDGETTIVIALIASDNTVKVLSLGDSLYFICDDNSTYNSEYDLAMRGILGSEPLGDVITSSGNILLSVNSRFPKTHVFENVTSYFICSDGLMIQHEKDYHDIIQLINGTDSMALGNEIIKRALNIFEERETAPDNISFIYGYKRC